MEYVLAICPHCGGEARLRVDNIKIDWRREKAAWVYCGQCFAKTTYFRRALYPEDYVYRAVIAWNMRIDWEMAFEEDDDGEEEA